MMANPEDLQAGIPFVNASKMRVPPFGVMEVVGDPKGWVSSGTPESDNKIYLGLGRTRGTGVYGQLDNRQMIFCAEPGVWCEYLQNPAHVVFNGPSPVDPGASGKCFRGYPMRAATATNGLDPGDIPEAGGPSMALRITAGSFALYPSGDPRRGAFAWRGRTEQGVKYRNKGETVDRVAEASFIEPNYIQESEATEVSGLWYVKGAGKTPIVPSVETASVSANAAFDFSGETLTLRATGTYQFLFEAILRQRGGTIRTPYAPYRIGMVPFKSEDIGRFIRPGVYGSFTPQTFHLNQWLKRWLPNYGSIVYAYDSNPGMMPADYAPKTKDMVRWEYNVFRYFDIVTVTRPPVKLCILQDLSPLIQTGPGFGRKDGAAAKFPVDPARFTAQLVPLRLQNPGMYYRFLYGDGVTFGADGNNIFPLDIEPAVDPTYQTSSGYFNAGEPWVEIQ